MIDPMATGAIDDRPQTRTNPASGRLLRPTLPPRSTTRPAGASNNVDTASPTPPPTVGHPSTLRDCAVAGEPASTMAKAAITVRTILRVVRALL